MVPMACRLTPLRLKELTHGPGAVVWWVQVVLAWGILMGVSWGTPAWYLHILSLSQHLASLSRYEWRVDWEAVD